MLKHVSFTQANPTVFAHALNEKAKSRLANAKKTCAAYRTEMGEKQLVLDDRRMSSSSLVTRSLTLYLEIQIEQLQRELNEKRKVAMMLAALEKQENLRLKRFQEINGLLRSLRCAPVSTTALHFLD